MHDDGGTSGATQEATDRADEKGCHLSIGLYRSTGWSIEDPDLFGKAQAAFGLAVLLNWVGQSASVWRAGGRGMLRIGLLFVCCVVAIETIRWWKAKFRSTFPLRLPEMRERVLCFGCDADLVGLGPFHDKMHEPEIFNVSWRCGGLRVQRPLRWIGFAIGLVAGIAVQTPANSPPMAIESLAIAVAVGCLGSFAFATLLQPVHLLVSPGRAEIIRSGFAGVGNPVRTQLDLGRAKIDVRMYERVVVIHEPTLGNFAIGGLLDPTFTPLARAIILAAVSAHTIPEGENDLDA